MYAHYLSRKFHKYASLSLALALNVYLSLLLVYDTIFKSFMLCHPASYPSDKFCSSFISYIFYVNITPLDKHDAPQIY
jgi:hypothetical protein